MIPPRKSSFSSAAAVGSSKSVLSSHEPPDRKPDQSFAGDGYAEQAVKLLHREGLDVGESGAAGVAALLALRDEPASAGNLPLERHSRVLCLATEGPTDPRLHQRLLYGTP